MRKKKRAKKKGYPGAVLVKDACYYEYTRMIQTYDKLYDKVNFSLAFCGGLLIVIIQKFDYTKMIQFKTLVDNKEILVNVIYDLAYICSVGFIFCTVIGLLGLLKGREIMTFDSISARDNGLYEENNQDASVWLIDKYTRSVNSLQCVIQEKQANYDKTIVRAIVALLAFAIASILEKGI